MGLRSTLAQLLSAPTALLLEAALRDLVEEILDARDHVRKSELSAVDDRIDALRRELTERHADLEAVRQAMAAWGDDLDDGLEGTLGLDEEALDALDEARDALARKLDRATGAVSAAAAQLEALAGRVTELEGRADRAAQLATTARATAEAAADGASALEHRTA